MEETTEDQMTSQQVLCVAEQKISKRPGISTLKVLKFSVINVYLLLTCDATVEKKLWLKAQQAEQYCPFSASLGNKFKPGW